MITNKELNLPLYLFGSPCKINVDDDIIYGRYIGDSNIPVLNDKIVLICTPCNSIRHVLQSKVNFKLSEEDLLSLKKFEDDAISRGEWYHKNRDPNEILMESIILFNDISPIINKDIV